MSWKIFSLLTAILILNSCTKKENLWHPNLYGPDPSSGSIVRGEEKISCTDTAMSNFICLPKKHLEILHSHCVGRK